jgi:ABC-type Na+ efflux pump permease subunit
VTASQIAFEAVVHGFGYAVGAGLLAGLVGYFVGAMAHTIREWSLGS